MGCAVGPYKQTDVGFTRRVHGSCICEPGYVGQFCDVRTNQTKLCHDHGSWNESLRRCICLPNFVGKHCDQPNPMFHLPCETGCSGHGHCSVQGNCSCDAGWKGIKCQISSMDRVVSHGLSSL